MDENLKLKAIQKHLNLLLHASKCQHTGPDPCPVSYHCQSFKAVLAHIPMCSVDSQCTFRYCDSSKKLINHWKTCQRAECPVCAPNLHQYHQNSSNLHDSRRFFPPISIKTSDGFYPNQQDNSQNMLQYESQQQQFNNLEINHEEIFRIDNNNTNNQMDTSDNQTFNSLLDEAFAAASNLTQDDQIDLEMFDQFDQFDTSLPFQSEQQQQFINFAIPADVHVPPLPQQEPSQPPPPPLVSSSHHQRVEELLQNDSMSLKLIQKRLVLFMHARKCGKQQFSCHVPECAQMKSLVEHMVTCANRFDCTFDNCRLTKRILRHWKYCKTETCPICAPLRRKNP